MNYAQSFFFYDLETSGLDARRDRVMQFAGQRTTMALEPVGEPYNVLVRLSDDVLPSPEAILVTGITPQKTQEEGISEAEFAKLFAQEICTPGTIVVGFNSIRFDDEFIRHTLWRTFHDPYEWSWRDGRSRWDLLDVVRMTRALRPEGIQWPVDKDGKPTNRLELLTTENNLEHVQAHDALSDVRALIAVTKMIRDKQPKLYEYLLNTRDKKAVMRLVSLDDPKPFVYTSGRYDAAFQKTTVAYPIAEGGKPGSIFVYDLRHNPDNFADMSVGDIKKRLFATWEERQAPDFMPIPVKELTFNRAPAVAPLGVLEQASGWDNIQFDGDTLRKHLRILQRSPEIVAKLKEAFDGRKPFPKTTDVDGQLYDGFIGDGDKLHSEVVRNATERELSRFTPNFSDERLTKLLLRYKARNLPNALHEDEQAAWEAYRTERLRADLPKFMESIARMTKRNRSEEAQFLLQELQLWAESIIPLED
jgi:exodeoxyribonuclease-1